MNSPSATRVPKNSRPPASAATRCFVRDGELFIRTKSAAERVSHDEFERADVLRGDSADRAAWSYYYLYVIMDIYSRYVVGWMVADRENSALAGRLIQQSCLKHGVQPRVLTLHSDRGAPMTSQCTAQLLADLGVTRSLSRPQVSDDNPFSEAQFKTLKYHPSFPGRFGDQGQAKTFCRSFFRWYNAEHRHGGISMLTPEQVHFGNADQVIAGRNPCSAKHGPLIPNASSASRRRSRTSASPGRRR